MARQMLEEEKARKKELLTSATEQLQSRFAERFSGQLDIDPSESLDGLIEEDLTPEALIEIARLIEVLNESVGWAHDPDKVGAEVALEGILEAAASSRGITWIDSESHEFVLRDGKMIDLVPNAHSGLMVGNGRHRTKKSMAYVMMPEGSRWSGLNNDKGELLQAYRAVIDAGLPLHPTHIEEIGDIEAELAG